MDTGKESGSQSARSVATVGLIVGTGVILRSGQGLRSGRWSVKYGLEGRGHEKSLESMKGMSDMEGGSDIGN